MRNKIILGILIITAIALSLIVIHNINNVESKPQEKSVICFDEEPVCIISEVEHE